MEPAWPFVERQRHLRHIAEAVRQPGLCAVVISGAAGLGKTRLAKAALQQAERRGLPTRWVVATHAAAGLPFAAVAHLLTGAQPSASPVELLEHAHRAVAQPGGSRMVLGVDDAHLLDDASATLVGHLAGSGAAFVVCTLRSGEVAPDAVTALVTAGRGEAITLDRLSEDAVAALLQEVLDGQVDGAAVYRLRHLSDGNPLLLRELFADARQQGALVEGGGLWRLDEGWSPGARLADLVRARLAALSGPGREAAEALALAEPLEASVLEALFAGDVLDAVDGAGLLEALPDQRRQRLRLVHPLYGEALRAAVAPLRTRALHRRLAGALESTGARRRGDLLRLASWRLAAGEGGHGPTFLAATREARDLFDHPLAERLARAAVQAGAGFAATLALAEALRWQGRVQDADDLLRDWQDAEGGDDARERTALLGIYGNATVGHPGVDELLTKAEALVTGRRGRDQLAAVRADLALGRWRPREALALAWPLMTDPDAGPDAVVMASETAAAALAFAGRTEETLAVAASALALIRGGDLAIAGVLEWPLLAETVLAHLLGGRLERARALAGEQYVAALERGVAPPQAWFGFLQGQVALLGGALPTALQWLREAVLLMRAHPGAQGRHVRAMGLGLLAEAAAVHGDVAAARAALDEADALLDPEVAVVPRALGRAWTAAAAGDPAAARRLALDAADAAADSGAHAYEAFALHDALRLGVEGRQRARAAERLVRLARQVDGGMVEAFAAHAVALRDGDGEMVEAFAAHAVALRDGDGEALDAAAAVLSDLGLLPRAAEAFAHAAAAWGPGARGSASARRSRELADRCEGVHALARDTAASPLTAREREIATLAGSGLSNQAIAQHLVISERTVENHLHRIYRKLAISGREELGPP